MDIPHQSIVVPTKNRARTITTHKFFPNAILVVEPQDVESYQAHGHQRLHVLPENNQGIAFVRNYILSNAVGHVIVADDDVSGFSRFNKTKTIPGNESAFFLHSRRPAGGFCVQGEGVSLAMFGAMSSGLSMCGPIHKARSIYSRKFSGCYRLWCVVGIDAPCLRKAGLVYDPAVSLFEDFDFQLQAMNLGLRVGALMRWCFDCAKNGANAGGLNDGFRNIKQQQTSINNMIAKWKHIEPVIKNRGIEPKILWSQLSLRVEEVW